LRRRGAGSLGGDGRSILSGQLSQGSYRQDGVLAFASDPPSTTNEAVDQHRPERPAIIGSQQLSMGVGGDTGAVGMGKKRVVVLGQESRWRGGVGIGPRRLGQVEELTPTLVPEHRQSRPKPLNDLGQPAQARPGPDVCRARRTEGRQVP
jgi:hypothetical protein